MNRYVKSEVAQLKSDINQNANLAVDNDGRLKEGLARLEAQVIANGAATAELRGDVRKRYMDLRNTRASPRARKQRHLKPQKCRRFDSSWKNSTVGASMTSEPSTMAATRSSSAPKPS